MDLPSTREAMSMSARSRGRRGRKSIPTRHGPTVSAHCRSSERWAESRARLRETTMRAVWYDRQGAADEVLVCGELPTPNAGHGEVRVKLEASGVNPSDTYDGAARLPWNTPGSSPTATVPGSSIKSGRE